MKKTRYILIVGSLFLDLLVKVVVRSSMYAGQSIPVIQDFFHLTYVRNEGAAFNLFEGKAAFLTMVPFLALLFAVWYMEKHRDGHPTLLVSLILIISGGLGNLIDRVFLGFVTDLFDFRFFPVFNIADIAICVGCGFLILYIFIFDGKETKKYVDTGEQSE